MLVSPPIGGLIKNLAPVLDVPGPAEDGEEALVARAAGGDRAAFAEFYQIHHRQVYLYLRYRIAHREDAEDLTQQAFLQAWRWLAKSGPISAPLVPWLLTIAHNLAVSFYRKHRSTEPIEEHPPEPDADQDPARLSETHFEHERVRAAILKLKPEQQQVISMRYLQELSHREIARALGRSEVNIRVIQHRALGEVKRILTREAVVWQ